MKKQLKKWGDSIIIVLSPEDLRFYNLKVGDWVNIRDIIKINTRNKIVKMKK